MKSTKGRSLKGIGENRHYIGTGRIQINFMQLGIVIEADFLIIGENVPSLLSMRDMVKNGL